MNAGEKLPIKIAFPFSLYLKQLFSTDPYVRYINPFSFWRRYKINHLETCHELNTVQYLKRCYQLDSQLAKSTKILLDRGYVDTLTNSLLKQAEFNTIYISQPWIELKYRGVSYYSKDVFSININLIEIDPNVVQLNSFGRTDNSNNASTPKESSSN